MDLFLIGFASTGESQDLELTLAKRGHGARLVRDWSSLTKDDTFWGVVVDAPDAPSVHAAADELGFDVSGLIRLVPWRPHIQPGEDWVTTMVEVLPSEPPPPLGKSLQAQEGSPEIQNVLPPDAEACNICGWIGEHDPAVIHPTVK